MVAGVKVRFGVNGDQLKPTLDGHNEGAEKFKTKLRDVTAGWRDSERAALRALKRSETAQDKLNKEVGGLDSLLKRNKISQDQYSRAVEDANRHHHEQAGIVGELKEQILSQAAAYGTVAGAIGLVTSGLRAALELERQRQDITRTDTDARLNFALLNRGNIAEETDEVRRIGRQFGFGRNEEEVNALFDIAQSLQSGIEGETDGRAALRGVLEARLVGIDPETAKELVVQGRTQGEEDPTTFLRRALRTGQLSSRSAEEVARNARSLQFFDDKDLGFAAAAKLTDQFKNESETFVKAAGTALTSFVDRGAIGLGQDASQEDVLRRLAERGIDSESELRAVGLGEIRRIQAVQSLVTNLTEVLDEAVESRAVANDRGFLSRERAALVAEDDTFALDRQARQREVEVTQERTSRAAAARRLVDQQIARDIDSLTGRGGFISAVGEDGRVNGGAALAAGVSVAGSADQLVLGFIRLGLDRIAQATEATAANTSSPPPQEQANAAEAP